MGKRKNEVYQLEKRSPNFCYLQRYDSVHGKPEKIFRQTIKTNKIGQQCFWMHNQHIKINSFAVYQ